MTATATASHIAPAHLQRYYLMFALLAILAVATILSNLALRRGPVHDAQAVTDLRLLQSTVDSYYVAQGQLPSSLTAAHPAGDVTRRLASYQYHITSATSYQLCTTFLTVHHSTNSYTYPLITPGGVKSADPDEHGQGNQCFSYTILATQPGYPYRLKP